MQAVFAGVDRANRPYDPDPRVRAQRLAVLKRRQTLQGGPAAATVLLLDPAVRAEVASWEKAAQVGSTWHVLDITHFNSTDGSTLTKQLDGSLLAGGKRPERDTYTIAARWDGKAITAIRLEVLGDPSLPHGGPGRQDNGNLHLSEFRIEAAPQATSAARPVAIARAVADFDQAGWGIAAPSTANAKPPGAFTRRSARRTPPSSCSRSRWPATSSSRSRWSSSTAAATSSAGRVSPPRPARLNPCNRCRRRSSKSSPAPPTSAATRRSWSWHTSRCCRRPTPTLRGYRRRNSSMPRRATSCRTGASVRPTVVGRSTC